MAKTTISKVERTGSGLALTLTTTADGEAIKETLNVDAYASPGFVAGKISAIAAAHAKAHDLGDIAQAWMDEGRVFEPAAPPVAPAAVDPPLKSKAESK